MRPDSIRIFRPNGVHIVSSIRIMALLLSVAIGLSAFVARVGLDTYSLSPQAKVKMKVLQWSADNLPYKSQYVASEPCYEGHESSQRYRGCFFPLSLLNDVEREQKSVVTEHFYAYREAENRVRVNEKLIIANSVIASPGLLETLGSDWHRDANVALGVPRFLEGNDVVVSSTFAQRYLATGKLTDRTTLYVDGKAYNVAGIMPAKFQGIYRGKPWDLWIPLPNEAAAVTHGEDAWIYEIFAVGLDDRHGIGQFALPNFDPKPGGQATSTIQVYAVPAKDGLIGLQNVLAPYRNSLWVAATLLFSVALLSFALQSIAGMWSLNLWQSLAGTIGILFVGGLTAPYLAARLIRAITGELAVPVQLITPAFPEAFHICALVCVPACIIVAVVTLLRARVIKVKGSIQTIRLICILLLIVGGTFLMACAYNLLAGSQSDGSSEAAARSLTSVMFQSPKGTTSTSEGKSPVLKAIAAIDQMHGVMDSTISSTDPTQPVRSMMNVFSMQNGYPSGQRAGVLYVGPGFAKTMNLKLMTGRDLSPDDWDSSGVSPILVDTDFIRSRPGWSPHVGDKLASTRTADGTWFEIVGVVDDHSINQALPAHDGVIYIPDHGRHGYLIVAMDGPHDLVPEAQIESMLSTADIDIATSPFTNVYQSISHRIASKRELAGFLLAASLVLFILLTLLLVDVISVGERYSGLIPISVVTIWRWSIVAGVSAASLGAGRFMPGPIVEPKHYWTIALVTGVIAIIGGKFLQGWLRSSAVSKDEVAVDSTVAAEVF